MHENEVKVTGRLFGIQKLVTALGIFFEKGSELVDHCGDVFGKVQDLCEEAQAALRAYSLTKTLDYKIRSDPEYMALEQQVAKIELKQKRSDLDRVRTKLEKRIRELVQEEERLKRRKTGVNQALKNGTTEVKSNKASQLSREKRPLTHNIDLTGVDTQTGAVKDAVAAEPPATEASP